VVIAVYPDDMLAYFHAKLDIVRDTYGQAREDADVDAVHDMRVAIKRIRAYFRMVESIDPEFVAREQARPFRKIARRSAALRDVQVQESLVDEIGKDTGHDLRVFRTYLTDRERDGISIFMDFTAKRNRMKVLDRRIKTVGKALQTVTPVRAETLAWGRFRNLVNQLVIMQQGDLTPEALHDVRKHAKETHYAYEIVSSCFHGLDNGDIFLKRLKKVHGTLGSWHDYDIHQDYLASFSGACEVDMRAEPYPAYRREISRRKSALRRTFRKHLTAFSDVAVSI
jgi:CHAD domain-containing protein